MSYQPPNNQPWQQPPNTNYPPQQPPYQPLIQVQQERNYTPAAWLSAGLAFLFIVPGLIATIIYLTEAYNVKKRTGITPQGYGCLWAVLVWCVVPPL